jgi:hypothetical protein
MISDGDQFSGRFMRLAQLAGIAMTAAVVTGVNLELGWAISLGMLAGGLTTLLVSLIEQRSRD